MGVEFVSNPKNEDVAKVLAALEDFKGKHSFTEIAKHVGWTDFAELRTILSVLNRQEKIKGEIFGNDFEIF